MFEKLWYVAKESDLRQAWRTREQSKHDRAM